MRKTTSQPNTY